MLVGRMSMRILFSTALFLTLLGCASPGVAQTVEIPDTAATATLAGGCFWCVESAFDGVDGVYAAVSGYTGGEMPDPTYEQVSAGRSGHCGRAVKRHIAKKPGRLRGRAFCLADTG